jgi:N-sulfoglucosamine sulfohydrolase
MRFSRRNFLLGLSGASAASVLFHCGSRATKRPNILFAISDDQSFPHTSIAGDPVVKTPAFDRVAKEGVLFRNAISNSPGCAPSRAAILTGRGHWQLGEAGVHASYFPRELKVFPELLEQAGYHVGLTGKGAGPANFEGSGWEHNPAGKAYSARKLAEPRPGMSPLDYAANFEDFLKEKPADRPFCFWSGAQEPHRVFEKGIGRAAGKRLEDVVVPGFLPDTEEIRNDLLDYYEEIEHFDTHLGRMLEMLEKAGELENTLVVVTSDNGMAFPRAKATMYEYGIHLPLAIMWKAQCPGGRVVDDMVSFIDYAPTFLEVAGVSAPEETTGKSLVPVLRSTKSGVVDETRTSALSGRERHSHARRDNLGYPARSIRTREYLYIRNFAPERNPAGDPEGFHDIDDAPSKTYLLEHRNDPKVKPFFDATMLPNPAEQLFDIQADPFCMKNLAADPAYASVREKLATELESTLRAQGDPRILGTGDIFESYPRHSPMRPQLGGFAEQGQYNPAFQRQ